MVSKRMVKQCNYYKVHEMHNGRVKTALQWLAELAAREFLRAVGRWIWRLIKSDGSL